ncbi:MAG: hypothetical protein IJK97_11845, partial [Thermoguttaceae bacterium]|nr:hypothetical protein [Thermoguttaceae bacterium]
MSEIKNHSSCEIDAILRNAELRSELEPFYDESIVQVEDSHLPIEVENDYLEMMLAWEVAPVLPIAQWFNPPL